MEWALALQANFTLTLILAAVLGLIVGSFLNVVITRYPVMLEREFRKECQQYLHNQTDESHPAFNLALPPSHCPECKNKLKLWHNIPIISYLLLRGRCGYCHCRISAIYPLIEIITALLTLWVVWHFGISLKTIPAVILTWGLIILSMIDLKHQWLPDSITLSLLWIGMFLSLYDIFTPAYSAILGAISAYVFLWLLASIYKLVRKRQGMGHGDFKMYAMFGAWLGLGMLLNIIFVAALVGLLTAILLLLSKKIHITQPLSFGPFIALGGWLTMMYGPFINLWINQLLQ